MDSITNELLDGSLVILGDGEFCHSCEKSMCAKVKKILPKNNSVEYSLLIDRRILAMVDLLRKHPDLQPVIEAYADFIAEEAVELSAMETAGADY